MMSTENQEYVCVIPELNDIVVAFRFKEKLIRAEIATSKLSRLASFDDPDALSASMNKYINLKGQLQGIEYAIERTITMDKHLGGINND